MSTSSPATQYCGSKPPIASRLDFQNAMLQPGMCSAISSESSTWIGPPGAFATHSATSPSLGGGMFGPPMPACELFRNAGREVGEPVRVGTRVGVDVGDDLAGGRVQPLVARVGEALVLGADQAEAVLLGDLVGAVGRAVVDDDHLVVGIVQLAAARRSSCAACPRCCTRTRRPRSAARRGRPGTASPRTPCRPSRAPASARGRGPPGRRPSPRCRSRRGATRRSRRTRTSPRTRPRRRCGPASRARCAWAPSELRSESRPASVTSSGPVAGDVLEAGEIGLELGARLEEDVEADEVDEGQLEVLGAGVVDVGDERLGVLLLGRVVEPAQEPLDPPPAVPAHDRGGDLVADRVAEDRGMARRSERIDSRTFCTMALARPRSLRKAMCCSHGMPDHHPEAVLVGEVEQPARGNCVSAHRVDSVRGHLGEVLGDRLYRRKVAALVVGTEGPVGDASDVDLPIALENGFPMGSEAIGGCRGRDA